MLDPLQEQLREIIDSLTEGQTAAHLQPPLSGPPALWSGSGGNTPESGRGDANQRNTLSRVPI